MSLLISNDDGVHARGIGILVEYLSKISSLEVYAPSMNKSASSHSLSIKRSIAISELDNGFYSVDGTPADCIHLAIHGKSVNVDQVISGINHGANLGDDVLYSGTVAAAFEARDLDKPSIAVSLCGEKQEGFICAAQVVCKLLPCINQLDLPKGTIFNINVPNCSYEVLNGIEITRLGHRGVCSKPILENIDDEKEYWRLSTTGQGLDAGKGTDFHAIQNKFVSLTPLFFDQTNYNLLGYLKKRITL